MTTGSNPTVTSTPAPIPATATDGAYAVLWSFRRLRDLAMEFLDGAPEELKSTEDFRDAMADLEYLDVNRVADLGDRDGDKLADAGITAEAWQKFVVARVSVGK